MVAFTSSGCLYSSLALRWSSFSSPASSPLPSSSLESWFEPYEPVIKVKLRSFTQEYINILDIVVWSQLIFICNVKKYTVGSCPRAGNQLGTHHRLKPFCHLVSQLQQLWEQTHMLLVSHPGEAAEYTHSHHSGEITTPSHQRQGSQCVTHPVSTIDCM